MWKTFVILAALVSASAQQQPPAAPAPEPKKGQDQGIARQRESVRRQAGGEQAAGDDWFAVPWGRFVWSEGEKSDKATAVSPDAFKGN